MWRSVQLGQTGHVSGNMFQLNASSHNVIEKCHFGRAGHCPFCLWIDSHHNVAAGASSMGAGAQLRAVHGAAHALRGCVITNTYHGRAPLTAGPSCSRATASSGATWSRNYYQPLSIHAYRYQQMEPFGMISSRLSRTPSWPTTSPASRCSISLPGLTRTWSVATSFSTTFSRSTTRMATAWPEPGPSIAARQPLHPQLSLGPKPGTPSIRYAWNDGRPGALRTAAEANAACPDQFTGNLDGDPRFRGRGARRLPPASR